MTGQGRRTVGPFDRCQVLGVHLEQRQVRFLVRGKANGIELGAVLEALAEFVRLGAQGLVAQSLNRRLELVGRADISAVASNEPLIAAAEDAGEKVQQLDVLGRENAWPDNHLLS